MEVGVGAGIIIVKICKDHTDYSLWKMEGRPVLIWVH